MIAQSLRAFSPRAFDSGEIRAVETIDASVLVQSAPQIANHWEENATEENRRHVEKMVWSRGRYPLISCVEFTPDGRHLAVGTCSGVALLWDLEKHQVTQVIDCQSDLIYRIEISSDQRWLVTLGTAARLVELVLNLGPDESERQDAERQGIATLRPELLYDKEQTNRADFSPDHPAVLGNGGTQTSL